MGPVEPRLGNHDAVAPAQYKKPEKTLKPLFVTHTPPPKTPKLPALAAKIKEGTSASLLFYPVHVLTVLEVF